MPSRPRVETLSRLDTKISLTGFSAFQPRVVSRTMLNTEYFEKPVDVKTRIVDVDEVVNYKFQTAQLHVVGHRYMIAAHLAPGLVRTV